MKYVLLFITVIFAACSPKIIPLKGSYPNTPIQISSTSNFEEVWDKLIDVFAQKGLSIKIIDKSSGLIVSDKSRLSATIEDKNGKLLDPLAFIVVPKFKSSYGDYAITGGGRPGAYSKNTITNDVYGDWNVRIKKTETGSVINVNIVNLSYQTISDKTVQTVRLTDYKTTGVFEKLLSDLIK